ncbi:MAG: ABC transporter permease [Acidimicrobiia bacterium]|nr:ABC transporter permease [Acidimicrobiia bacterium]
MSAARIVDQGYRSYDGPRGGVFEAMRTLTLFSLGRAMGIRRGLWPKILPISIVAISFLPAIVFVGMAALLPEEIVDELIAYGEYYGYITAAILLFTAFVAPELLCTDRRTRMLGLYFASPLNRMTYLASKATTVAIALTFVTMGPPLLMLLAYTLEGVGPDSVGEFLGLLVRIVLAGVVISAVHTSLSLAVSSFTDRNGLASAGVIFILLLTPVIANSLVEGADAPDAILALDLFSMPFELVTRIFDGVEYGYPQLSTGFLVVVNLGWTLLFAALVVWRYRRIEVTK